MTKKILVPIDIDNPKKSFRDFLFPDPSGGKLTLRGIKTGKEWEFGMIILTSEINENDIFRNIIDSGKKIESVDVLLKTLKEYVYELPKYRIGNILKLNTELNHVDFIVEYQRLTRKRGSV